CAVGPLTNFDYW
nr:immunoglobulin heavy chain junction region [Macaca mulatta]MOW18945.1 immunoglobulin heavy chain junction region [Macaca mulatta]MOW19055.1 immunoglobulin heavy chain junction region [Macaca mulatta]MOW19287.1 immunoglobulin heavy chain junction region [Macaca mulatta]MOW19324.1 immunoglobulin heavy chain junction region [Macaca mulatta]